MFKHVTRAASVAMAAALLAAPAGAQELSYTTVSEVEFGGAFGQMMSLFGGDAMRSSETTSIRGQRMRVDSEGHSTVMDFSGGRFVSLDHEAREYTVFDFDALAGALGQTTVAPEGGETRFRVRPDDSERQPGDPEEVTVDVAVDVEPTDERRTIGGLEARRVFMTVSFEGEAVPAGETRSEEAGTLVILTDMWLSEEEFPEMAALYASQAEAGRDMVGANPGLGAALAQVYGANPDVAVAMERQAEELEQLQGMSLASVTYLVGVPPGMDFEREAALAFAEESLSSQVAGSAAGAAADAAAEQAKAAVSRLGGRLGGLFGGGDEEPEEEEPAEPEPAQSVLFRIRTEVTDVSRDGLDDGFFEVPADYTERPLPPMGG